MRQARPLQAFMLGVLLLFAPVFALWYWLAGFHLAPVVAVTGTLVDSLCPDALMWLRLDGHTLVLASNFGHDAAGQVVSPPTGDDLLGFHLNPLIYCYSLPLLAALTLAVPGSDRGLNLLWGVLLLFPVEVFSMVFSVLKTLTFDVGAAFQLQQGITPLGADLIALGYQAGVLILPMVAPLVIWIALHRRFIITLAPRLEQVLST